MWKYSFKKVEIFRLQNIQVNIPTRQMNNNLKDISTAVLIINKSASSSIVISIIPLKLSTLLFFLLFIPTKKFIQKMYIVNELELTLCELSRPRQTF